MSRTRTYSYKNHRVKKAISPKQVREKRKKRKEMIRRALRVFLLILPIVIIALLYLLCIWGIFCVNKLFNFSRPSMVGKITQKFVLNGDVLSLTDANSVDLSSFHEYYTAGEGLNLTGFEFSLADSGVTPGIYGSSASIPVLEIDQYGRVTHAETVPVASFQTHYHINDMSGPDFYIQGTQRQVLVDSDQNIITLKTPQDIDIDSSPSFANLILTEDLYLGHMIYDSLGNAGANNSVLVSDGNNVVWQDINAVTSDDQVLYWDPATYDLTIENGNTVNLSALNLWKQEPIGGWYTSDVLSPKDSNVQRIFMEHTGWGLTEVQIKNEDNTNNYSGAVLSLKGSGPDYTNNMFFAKLGDNYYVPSWAGKGVVSTDQPLIVASVKSNDPDHPNKNPYIMFQTGGYYTAPVDRMILDSDGNLGIGDFAPDDKLTVAGNIHLTGSNPGIIHARQIDLELTTEASRFGGGDIMIHPGDFGGNSGMPKSVYIYAGKQEVSPWMSYTGNVVLLSPKDSDEIIGHLLAGSKQALTDKNTLVQFAIPQDSNYEDLFTLVRYSNNANTAAFINQYRMRGDISNRQDVQVGDITGGLRSYAVMSPNFYNNASIVFRATSVNHGGGGLGGSNPGIGGSISLEVSDQSNVHRNALVAFEQGTVGIGVDNFVEDPISAQLAVQAKTADVAINILPTGKESGFLAFTDSNMQHVLGISIPKDLNEDYELYLPPEQGTQYDVMYNDGSGNLLWDKVEHLLSIGVGAHAILYSDGTNVVGDANHLYWDWDNHRLGINTTSPQAPLEVNIGSGPGIIVRKTGTSAAVHILVASNTTPSTAATRVDISNDGIYGTWYNSIYWNISRDLWGSGSPGIKLGGNSGMWYKLGTAGGSAVPQYSLVFTTNNAHRAVITKDGNVGVGTTNPGALFQVGEAGDGTYAIANDWQTFSDERLKTNIKPVSQDVLSNITSLQPVTYIWKNGKDTSLQIGFIAQDLKKVFPLLVKKLDTGLYTVNYSKLSVYIVQAIKEIVVQLTTLSKQVQDLKTQNQKLQQQVDVLNQQVKDLQQRVAALENNNPSPTLTPKPKPTPLGTPVPTPSKIITPTGSVK